MDQRFTKGLTTFGEEVVPHDAAICAESEEYHGLMSAIKKYLKTEGSMGGWRDKRFVVAHFNNYCRDRVFDPKYLLVGEYAFYSFSINEGLLLDGCRGLVDPGEIPQGLQSDAVEACNALQLPRIGHGADAICLLPENCPTTVTGPVDAYLKMRDWLDEYAPIINARPFVFVLREHIPVANLCLKWLKFKATGGATDSYAYKIAPLSVLAIALRDMYPIGIIPEFPVESSVDKILQHLKYAYDPEIACEWHAMPNKEGDAVEHCSSNIVQRMIYNLVGYFRLCNGQKLFPPFFKPDIK